MPKGYSKKVIMFPAGASGNFLATFLLVNSNLLPQPTFRVDWNQPISSSVVMASGTTNQVDYRLAGIDKNAVLQNIRTLIEEDDRQIILSHYLGISNIIDYADQCWIRKIYPTTNVFGWIKNIEFKKQQLEYVDYSQTSMSSRIDQALMIISKWYEIYKTDTDLPNGFLIDFGRLYNIEYLAELFEDANGIEMPNEKKVWAQEYIDQQFPALEDSNSLKFNEILELINPKDFFDLAVVLFIYEKNHDTFDTGRNWTIDNLPDNLQEAVEFLKNNQYNYRKLYA